MAWLAVNYKFVLLKEGGRTSALKIDTIKQSTGQSRMQQNIVLRLGHDKEEAGFEICDCERLPSERFKPA